MTEVVFLGTGGPLATRKRDNTAFLLRSEEGCSLVDCPGSVVQKILKAGVEPFDVGTVVITHVHPDHVYGLPSLVHSLMLLDHIIRLFGSPETIAFCRDLLDIFHLQKPKFRTRIDFIPIEPGRPAELFEGVKLSSLRVPHHPSSLALQFRFESGPLKLVFSGDTPIHPDFFGWAEEADALFHDCSAPSRFFGLYPALSAVHTNSAELGTWSERAKIRRLFPCHFLGELDFEIAEIEDEIKERFRGDLFVPTDFDRVVIG